MNLKRLISAVFALALLIVGVASLSQHGVRPKPVILAFSDLRHADHFFIEADRPRGRIECPVNSLRDWGEIWESELSPCSLGDGWLHPDGSGSQVFGTRARIQIELADQTSRILALRIQGSRYLPDDVEQSVRILANGHDLGRHPVSRKWRSIRQGIKRDQLLVGRNEIILEFAHAASRRQAGIDKDNFAIAARVNRLDLLLSSGEFPVAPSEPTPTDVWDRQRQAFAIGQSGTLVVPILVPPRAHDLEFDLQPSRSVDLTTLSVTLAVEDLDGRHRKTASIGGAAVRDRDVIGVPVVELAGRWALVTVEVFLDGGRLIISPPRIDPAGGEAATHPRSRPPVEVRSRPDIVLITLDAARQDRFSFAGYHRETTPFVDGIAGDSLVFPNAYALAPYTLCSVPTMITGLSFLDHGVTRHEDVLSDHAVTLAESLQQRGYLTAGFSATPNNSKSKGFAQGYEIFRELWTEAPAQESRRAHFLAKRVVDWLDSVTHDTRPLHLQVHMIPPHIPYDPRPEFDLFTDPQFNGPCQGDGTTISTLDGRETRADLECISHLKDLYDGILREADHATGIILRALQDRPRWENTVVLITSDHGEAFMEHGMLAHNSTVYSEMLHVPFVLRLPPKMRPPAIPTDRLVTLADIVPTLLGTAGIATTDSGSGIDLLAPATDTRGRAVVTRTTSSRPFMGLRTLGWSLMLDGAGSGALYDLSNDPGEHDNVSALRAARFAGLGKVLTRRIGLPPRLVVSTESAEITEAERDLLEALGYVRDSN